MPVATRMEMIIMRIPLTSFGLWLAVALLAYCFLVGIEVV